jgi:F0F1-type ATP synthase assembly protein I
VLYPLTFPIGLSVVAQVLVAVVLGWILELYRGARKPGTQRGDTLMLDLGLGLASFAATVLWFSVSLQIAF